MTAGGEAAGPSQVTSRRTFVLLFAATGATALAYQLVWSRLLAREFGGTLVTTSAVVSCYLVGLAIGAVLLGPITDRSRNPLRIYALLETAVGLYALASESIASWLPQQILSTDGGAGQIFAVTALYLLPPTIVMGGSFPAILRAAGAGDVDRSVPALLYGANTTGAVVGVLVAAFIALPYLGMRKTLLAAGVVNLVAALVAFVISRRHDGEAPAQPESAATTGTSPGGSRHNRALAVLAMSGCAALIGEVAWTRALALVLGSSVYAFALVLAAFLLGLGFGSLRYSRHSPTGDPMEDLVHYQLRAGVAGCLFAVLLTAAPQLLIRLLSSTTGSPVPMALGGFITAFAATAYATTALGAAFPAALSELTRTTPIGRASGLAYAVNTLGAVIGAVATAVFLIPRLGLPYALAIGVLLNLAAAVVASGGRRKLAVVVAASSVAVVVLLPAWWRQNQEVLVSGVYAYAYKYADPKHSRVPAASLLPMPQLAPTASAEETEPALIWVKDGVHANVAVYRDENRNLSLLIDGKADASTAITGDMRTQLLLGHLPTLLHTGRPETALVIGLGSGVTVSALLQHTVSAIDVVEIEPVVAEVAASFFAKANQGALADRRTMLHIGDGRRWVKEHANRYDIITSEPSNLWMSGVTHLFTREFFAEAAVALKPDGLLCQWMHLYQVSPDDVRVVMRGILSNFDHINLFLDGPDLLVVASRTPLRPLENVSFPPLVAKDLKRVGVESPGSLAILRAGDRASLVAFAGDGPLHTDDRPILEYTAPLSLGRDRSAEIDRLLREATP